LNDPTTAQQYEVSLADALTFAVDFLLSVAASHAARYKVYIVGGRCARPHGISGGLLLARLASGNHSAERFFAVLRTTCCKNCCSG